MQLLLSPLVVVLVLSVVVVLGSCGIGVGVGVCVVDGGGGGGAVGVQLNAFAECAARPAGVVSVVPGAVLGAVFCVSIGVAVVVSAGGAGKRSRRKRSLSRVAWVAVVT